MSPPKAGPDGLVTERSSGGVPPVATQEDKMTPAPIKPLVSFDYLDKIDVRVGTILTVEDVAASDKLVRLKVDFGDHSRSILVGMRKERQNPKAELEGR